MIAKLMRFLSGVVALVSQPNNQITESVPDALVALEGKYHSLQNTNVALIRERRELSKRLRQMESMSDADRASEHASELDRVKYILQSRHGLNVSRMQIASAVENLSRQFEATGDAVRKLKLEASAWSHAVQYSTND